MTRTPFGALIAVALASAFVATWPFRGDLAQSIAVTTMARPLAHATSWRFVPDAVDVAELADDRSDVVVVGDYAIGGRELTASDIQMIRSQARAGSKFVLAYMNFSESSPASGTWDQAWSLSRPSWSAGDSCVVPDGMRVKFWEAEWKAVVYRRPGSYLDRIIALGFDGIYIGGLQSSMQFQVPAVALQNDAVNFITDMAAVARRKAPGFVVMADANAALLANAEFRSVIDGVGVEGLLYGATGSARRPMPDVRSTYDALRPALADGKQVFAVERIDATEDVVAQTARELRRRGIVPGFEATLRPKPLSEGNDCLR